MKYFAKREDIDDKIFFQTLEGHTVDALLILKRYMEEYRGFLEDFCKKWGIEKEKLFRNMFYTVYLHDIGKLTEKFQKNIVEGKHSSECPHAYYALFILQELDNFDPLIRNTPVEFAAILGHHTQLHTSIYSMVEKTPSFIKEAIEEFIKNMESIYNALGFGSFFKFKKLCLKENGLKPLSLRKMRDGRDLFIKNIIRKYLDDGVPLKNDALIIKAVYSLILSVLQICDDYSSLNFKETIKNINNDFSEINSTFLSLLSPYTPADYILKLPENRKESIKKGKTLRKFQLDAERNLKTSVFLFAPCGRGKTDASLLWAFSVAKKYKKNKIVFALPTQVTCNAMYERLKIEFGEENVALYHGKSLTQNLIKKEKDNKKDGLETENTVDIEEIISENFKGKVFFKPITVTTIDHIILSFIHGFSQSDFSLGNLFNSCVIFDEIHYYDRVTMGHLFKLFPLMDSFQIPHFLMSGTLPTFLTEKFISYDVIIDEEGLKYKPFKLKIHDKMLVWRDSESWMINQRIIEDIVKNYRQEISQFVILNTVERAKQFYKEIKKKIPAILYHSQFTYNDRVSKEDKILTMEDKRKKSKKAYVLIATQVIEVSLDISADILYSELAPADALGQRAGRLNRGGKDWGGKHMLHIFKPESFRPYSEEIIEKTSKIVSRFDEMPLSYRDIKSMCDSIYSDYQPENSIFMRYFYDSIVFGHRPSELSTEEEEGKNFSTREENFLYVDVIPCSIYKELGEKAFSVQYLVKIPYYIYKNNQNYFEIKECKNKSFLIAKYHYDSDMGFDFHMKENCSNTNIL